MNTDISMLILNFCCPIDYLIHNLGFFFPIKGLTYIKNFSCSTSPLAWLAVLLALGHWAMGYVNPCNEFQDMDQNNIFFIKTMHSGSASILSTNSVKGASLKFNSLPPQGEWNFRKEIFNLIWLIDGWGISFKIALRWISLGISDYKSTLVQVMTWCRQATSHYLNQCWPRSDLPYGVTRPQSVKPAYIIHTYACIFPDIYQC